MALYVIKVPDIGEGIVEAEVSEWLVEAGELVAEDQPIATVTTDKATIEIPAPIAGRVVALAAEVGQIVVVGAELLSIDGVDGEDAGADEDRNDHWTENAQLPNDSDAPEPECREPPLTSPSIRAFAREHQIDLTRVSGTGPRGRILRTDIEAFARHADAIPDNRAVDGVIEKPLSGLRKTIARKMQDAVSVPQFTIVEGVDVEELEALRQALNAVSYSDPNRERLTIVPFIVRAMVRAVARHPAMNAHFDRAQDRIRLFSAVHVGVATHTPSGLIVPVLRHAESRSLRDTATSIAALAKAARAGRATPAELTGSTITLSSLGSLGGIATTPILNSPEVAIVGVNKMTVQPSWTGQCFSPRQHLNLSCSFDHRVIDGHEAAHFVRSVKAILETPALLFTGAEDE